jgi:hypothetical protein
LKYSFFTDDFFPNKGCGAEAGASCYRSLNGAIPSLVRPNGQNGSREESLQQRKEQLRRKGAGDASGKGCGRNSAAYFMRPDGVAGDGGSRYEMNAPGLPESCLLSIRESEVSIRVYHRLS